VPASLEDDYNTIYNKTMDIKGVKLERSGTGYIRMMAGTVLGHVVAYYLFAWRLDSMGAAIYFGTFILINILNIVLLYKCNLPLLNERGKMKKDIAKEEKIIIPLMLAFAFFIPSIVAGLEYGLINKSFTTPLLLLMGLALLIASSVLENWTMLVNRHFEKNIRIQSDREQTVITGGPYKFVRHPGYLGYILRLIAFPLMLGSWWAIVPVGIGIGVYVVRTGVEDRMLRRELKGYDEYSQRTKYRLVPLIW
jgi:protein-S-isoprenylcysteine O-methyltransferase Ste14